ncbi:metal-dependent hydrolase [Caloranaerobacter azorensis]|uniref:Hydrolase n=2 Tax=Caloranaerobacter azorensis TaxID=116090 RepID=A0A096BKD4_9FIRM|nr:metal-dependent hydrolase [Caloranaerobacter azorensis]KGG81317.1 hypothetical protein Y919_01465 [Caloranaerobacter azorensis H53214]QIB27985.1 metal-dependent hydrolase [Caloranaerobacter azorensis]
MKGKTHVMLGVAAGITAISDYSLEKGIIFISSTVLGSLMPDIDHPKSKLNQKLLFKKNRIFKFVFYIILSLGCIYFGISLNNKLLKILSITLAFTGLSHHRGFTHSLLGLLLFSMVVKILAIRYNLIGAYKGFVIGYISHLIADSFTKGGIELFYPCSIKIMFPFTIKSGGNEEELILKGLYFYLIYVLLKFIGV